MKISAGSYDLNRFLSGGYETDIITTLYGPAGSGKTNLCVLASVSQAKKGKKVIFIDTEGGFSIERAKQISGEDYENAIKNILLLKPTNFEEQKKAFEILLKELKKESVGLIIVDGMTMLYRLELASFKEGNDINKIQETNKELAEMLRTLAEIARNKNIPIIITNQIYYSFQNEEEWKSGKEKIANMVGGDLLKYWSKCLIELKNQSGKRTLLLRKHRSLPEKELGFIITNDGVKRRGFF
jgi:DNA repair protein RadB